MTAYPDDAATRVAIIDACLWLNDQGINQGTSGNVSLRVEDGFLITPSGMPYETMTPDMIVRLPLSGHPPEGLSWKPSTEWQFHQALFATRPEMTAVVHAHPVYATALSVLRQPIPACHYMVAAFGGNSVPVTDYALFGSDRLARMVAGTMTDRHGCLMANHGSIVVGETLEKALWRMQELETLAHVYSAARQIGDPVILSDDEINEALEAFASYGLRTPGET